MRSVWMMGIGSWVGLWVLGGWLQLGGLDQQTWAQVAAPSSEIRLDFDLQPREIPPAPFDLAQVDLAQAPPPARQGWLPGLDLSPAQMVQLRSIQQQTQGDLGQTTQELRQVRRELRDLLAGDASTDRVRDQYRRMKQLSRQIDDRRFEAILQVRQVLTPEQRRQMADLLADRTETFRDQFRERSLQDRPRFRR